MEVFFYICEYLGVTPAEFFEQDNTCPTRLRAVVEDMKPLDAEALTHLSWLVKQLRLR